MSSASETESALSREKLLRSSSESYRDVVVVRGISRCIRAALGISAAINVLLCSPANEAISYKEVVFDSSVQNGKTPYQGAPNAENNALWHHLYNKVGISQIPASSARLEVPSSPVPGHEDQHYIQLDVFHHLHCLNMIRLMLGKGWGHVDHCVDQIRQYLMCHADTTPLVWQWSERNKKYLTYMGMKHTCRDWDRFYGWAERHQSQWDYDRSRYVPGSPEWEDTKATVKWMKHIPGDFEE
ncbi:hypothetical protein INS49_012634 [Diaporthe citri]|uniref:uncharacterized protein n=1 Tax=Diaporthe citri TaxID=83186 RepID=UPI001C7F2141|nr:uncharacterized protein INS49_012634 [Diaporthe citri]KAG6359114.1 hypothetical protein INS49_012634 [Diaporthe citri]